MSIDAISLNSGPLLDSWRGTINQWKQGLGQLSDSLQSGDLAGAQSTLESLVKLHQRNEGRRPANSGNPTLQADFEALGKAIGSGDLSSAQNAFATLQTDMKAARQEFQSKHGIPLGTPQSGAPDSDSDGDGATASTGAVFNTYA